MEPASDLNRQPIDPFASPAPATVLLFVRTDCPVSKRYAPELGRIAKEFEHQGVKFWLVFPDRAETADNIRQAIADYHFPGSPLLDPAHLLVKRARAVTAPEAAVFDKTDKLVYHGRIDDLYVDIGKSRQAAQVHDLEDAIMAVLAGKPVRQSETQAVGCSLADVE
ncbi:MAG TPA: redoxin domain-containing protein [Bryobacteraceae bacterium]|nr:redoxin domain-containing protein [Bryobacteraceae bacterium]